MTQAVNLANFANYLDSSGGVSPNALNAPVPISKGGTGQTSANAARTALGLQIGTDIPAVDGTGATGTWNINITGTTGSFTTTNWTIQQVGSNLVFKYNGTTVASISSAGVVTASSDVIGGGTP